MGSLEIHFPRKPPFFPGKAHFVLRFFCCFVLRWSERMEGMKSKARLLVACRRGGEAARWGVEHVRLSVLGHSAGGPRGGADGAAALRVCLKASAKFITSASRASDVVSSVAVSAMVARRRLAALRDLGDLLRSLKIASAQSCVLGALVPGTGSIEAQRLAHANHTHQHPEIALYAHRGHGWVHRTSG